MGDILGHDQRLALRHQKDLAAHGEAAGTLQHRHHGVAAGSMGADFLVLFKGKEGHAELAVLHQCAADDLAVLIVHLLRHVQNLLLFNILIHNGVPPTK